MKNAWEAARRIPAGVPTIIAGLAMVVACFRTEIVDWLDYVGAGLLGSGTHIAWTSYDAANNLGIVGLILSTAIWLIAVVAVEAPPWATHGELHLMVPLFILSGLASIVFRYLVYPRLSLDAANPKPGSDRWAWLLVLATVIIRLVVY
ncbi:MAG: hypothetical protein ACOX5Q_06760 [Bacillota bacterium]|jgi:hypothetical protein|nr:hypothetical protein [Candidatus Fermentithermobacillaceae bacterium]